MAPRRAPLLVALCLALGLAQARTVTLSNVRLPSDTDGNALTTGEATVLAHGGEFFVYFNDWGGCAGVDCCDSTSGCASCCFNPPSSRYPDACVYTQNHTVVVYSTTDFESFAYLGEALPTTARRPGIEFRPQVVYNAALNVFVMWYEDRSPASQYAVAHAPTPQGPFVTVSAVVPMAKGGGRVGDFDIFVDNDGQAYHVRTGLTIERLAANYSASSGVAVNIPNGGVEGPSMFKRGSLYYILVGLGCCACRGGSNVVVYTADTPMGPYALRGDVGSNHTAGHVFDKASPSNYVTKAQGSKVVPVPAADGSTQFLWVGNQWVTSQLPGSPRNRDLLYFTVLEFDGAGEIQQIVYSESTVLSLPDVADAPVAEVTAPQPVRQNVTAYNTFYGARDNCMPGGGIAHPIIHKEAGGIGSYTDPITFAGATAALPPGTIIYSFRLSKYFIFEDDCEECTSDWKKSKEWHFDCWMGPDAVTPGPNLIACENALTVDKAVFELSPLATYVVDSTPLFEGTTLQCIEDAPPCDDKGDACGNECEIDKAGTCAQVAAELLMNLTRFEQLNKKLDCSATIKKGTNVCMGGTCGD